MSEYGDVDRAEYQALRDRINGELAQLQSNNEQAAALARAAEFLRDLPAAWRAATAEQRNTLARTVFQEVEITDDRVTAVLPVPEFAPFFNLRVVDTETGRATMAAPDPAVLPSGSDGDCSIPSITTASLLYLPTLEIDPATGELDSPSTPKRRGGKLTADQLDEICRLAGDRSLRDLAADYGVSHETIRKILRSKPVDAMAAD